MSKDEEAGVGAGLDEAEAGDVGNEVQEPLSRCLTKTIEGTGQQANSVGALRMLDASWLAAVDGFLQVAVQECVRDVQLMGWPPP